MRDRERERERVERGRKYMNESISDSVERQESWCGDVGRFSRRCLSEIQKKKDKKKKRSDIDYLDDHVDDKEWKGD